MPENFEEMYGGVYQHDPQAEAMTAALKELSILTKQLDVAVQALHSYAAERARYEKTSGIATRCLARQALAEINGFRKPKAP